MEKTFYNVIFLVAAGWLVLVAMGKASAPKHKSRPSWRQQAQAKTKGGVWANSGMVGTDASDDLPYATGQPG